MSALRVNSGTAIDADRETFAERNQEFEDHPSFCRHRSSRLPSGVACRDRTTFREAVVGFETLDELLDRGDADGLKVPRTCVRVLRGAFQVSVFQHLTLSIRLKRFPREGPKAHLSTWIEDRYHLSSHSPPGRRDWQRDYSTI